MSAFMVSNHLMQQVVTAILQTTDKFATIQTFRGQIVDDPPTDAQCKAAEDIGKRLFGMNAAAIKARYAFLPQRPVFKLTGWAARTPVEQYKAIRCLLYQSCEGILATFNGYDPAISRQRREDLCNAALDTRAATLEAARQFGGVHRTAGNEQQGLNRQGLLVSVGRERG